MFNVQDPPADRAESRSMQGVCERWWAAKNNRLRQTSQLFHAAFHQTVKCRLRLVFQLHIHHPRHLTRAIPDSNKHPGSSTTEHGAMTSDLQGINKPQTAKDSLYIFTLSCAVFYMDNVTAECHPNPLCWRHISMSVLSTTHTCQAFICHLSIKELRLKKKSRTRQSPASTEMTTGQT